MNHRRASISIALVAAAVGGTLAVASDGAASESVTSLVKPIDSLASPAGPGSGEPNLTVGPDGRVYMTWLEPADSGTALRFAVFRSGAWSPARTIRSGRDFFVNWADFPSIEVLDGGRLAVHWLQRSGTTSYAYGVRIAQSSNGGATWTPAVTPHRDSAPREHGFVAMWREKGRLGAAWLDGRKVAGEGHDAGNEMMLMSTTISPTGALGPEVALDDRTCDCCQNSAAVTANGPIIAYRNRSADEIRDIYVTRRVNGKWTAGAPVHDDGWKIAACPVNGPAIASAGTNVAVAWFTAANDSARVSVAFSRDAGARFAAPVRVDGGVPAGRVDLALLADGSALVTWLERTGGDTAAVRVRHVSPNGVASAPFTVASSSAARASGVPKMVVTGTQVIFAWTAPGKPSAVRVARAALKDLQ